MQKQMIVEPDKRTAWEDEIVALAHDHAPLTADVVVQRAKNKDSALHEMFTWDDTKAAAEYRLAQAGGLIRRVKVRFITADEDEVPVRMFASVKVLNDEGQSRGGYMTLVKVLESPDMTAQMLADAKRSLTTFRHKYAVLEELSTVIESIDAFITEQ